MARMRSPSYPSIPLGEAVELVRKIHSHNRTNVIDRESAAMDMGYSGLSGRALSILAALGQYDLISKAGKGQIKVSQLAVDILHSIDKRDADEALLRASKAPRLFEELAERFPDGIPSENAIRSYLVQQDYADAALGPAIKSFVETNHFVENTIDGGSHSVGAESAPESVSTAPSPQEQPVQNIEHPAHSSVGRTPPVTAIVPETDTPKLNKISMNIQGDRVHVSGLLDLKGLTSLEKKIAGLKSLLEPDEEGDYDGTEE